MRNKFGLSYILLDGEELLEDNVERMSKHFDYISIILTTESSSGLVPTKRCKDILKDLKQRGLVHEIYEVKPNQKIAGWQLRNTALNSLRFANCTHGCISDIDEFYEDRHIINCKKIIQREDIDIIYTKLKQYYADEKYAFKGVDGYTKTFCPFLFKVKKKLKYTNPGICPVMIDPNRKFNLNLKHKIIDPSVCYMHHLWMVRSEIFTKFKHRASILNVSVSTLNESINNWKKWKPGMPGMGFGNKKHELVKQNNTIKLNHFYKYANRR